MIGLIYQVYYITFIAFSQSVYLPCQIYFYLQYFLLELDLEDYLNPKLRHTVTLVGASAATQESHLRPLFQTRRLKLLKYHYHHFHQQVFLQSVQVVFLAHML